MEEMENQAIEIGPNLSLERKKKKQSKYEGRRDTTNSTSSKF